MLGIFALYGGLALAAYWPVFPGDPSRISTCMCGDPSLQTWFLGWVPFAVSHGHNVLYSGWTNYPFGVNLAQNTDMPLLGLLAAPLTVLAGPVSSYNLLMWLAFPLSGLAMYWVCWRWTGSRLGSILAGLLYGFSAYLVGQGVGHVMLSFVPLPPLYLYNFHKLVVRREGAPYLQGVVLGWLAVAQFFISSEIMASMILMSLFGLAAYLAANRKAISRGDLWFVSRGGVAASVLLLVVLAYPLWVVVAGPQHFPEPVRPVDNIYHGVGLGPILPTLSQKFSIPALSAYGHRLDPVENGQYLGIPLVLLVLLFAVWFRKSRPIQMAVFLTFVAYILSLGQHLGWTGLGGSFPLPGILLSRVPLLNNLIPERLTLYEGLFSALLVALGFAELLKPSRTARGAHPRIFRANQQAFRVWTATGFAVLALVTLIPRWPVPSHPTSIPTLFDSANKRLIPGGAVVLTYPFPYYPLNQAMTWQAEADMRFKEVGTYAFVRGSDGHPTTLPPFLDPASVESYLVHEEFPPGSFPAPQISDQQLAQDIKTFLARWQVTVVMVDVSDPTVRNSSAVADTFAQALGPPRTIGGIKLWVAK